MSMYESTATGLGGGGGLEDGGWGDGLAKVLQELVETEGVGMNFEGTNGGEESGLMVRHMCHILCDIFAITHKKTHYGIAYLFFLSNFHSILTTFISIIHLNNLMIGRQQCPFVSSNWQWWISSS